MKKIIIYMTVAICTLLGYSCEDLEQRPQSFIETPVFFEKATTEDIRLFMDRLYRTMWQGNYGFNCRLMRINEGADDLDISPTKLNNVLSYIRDLSPSATSNNDDFETPWALFYSVIYDANMCIQYTNMEIDTDERKALIGEAYFMRALNYFYLVRMFGDVPFYLKNEDAWDRMPRTAVAEVYENGIIPSLEKAIELLPTTSRLNNNSRAPSKWAAKACLADVYLTMAGWPLNKGTEYYAKSAEVSLDIINNSGLSLTSTYPDLWKEALKTQANEHMFAIYNSVANNMASQYGKSFYPADFYPNAGWSDYYANEEFMLKYPEGERKDWNYMTEWAIGLDATTKDTIVVNYKNSKDGIPAISKYYNYDNGKPGASAQSNGLTPIYRYADVLLMYAEASNMATGSVNSTALKCLQDVQNRAKSSEITTTTNSAEFDKAVFAERGWEFLAEFKRWFDLVRREKLSEVKPTQWASSVYKANNHYFLPVPYKEIELTGWTNNAGY